MSQENVVEEIALGGAPRAVVRALRTPRPCLARPLCTERVPPCRSLLAVKQAPEPRLVGRSDATTPRRPEMRAHTKRKHEIGKRFAILIGRGIKHRTLLVLSLAAIVGAIAVPVAQAQQSTSAEVVRDWNLYAANALVNPSNAPVMPGAGQGPSVAYLHLAMVQGAVYDAVNAIDGRHQPYLAGVPQASPSASKAAAAATAAHNVLVGL